MNIQIRDSVYSYFETGSGEYCLFLHGSRDRKEVFRCLIPYLEKHYKLIFIDLLGHGDTDKPREGYTFDRIITDIEEFVRLKGINHLNLIGHSLGGILSILFTLKHTDLVKKLVLLGVSPHFIPKFKRPAKIDIINKTTIENVNEAAAPFFFLPEYENVKHEILENWSLILPHVHANLIKMGHPDLRLKVKDITCPTLLVFGQKDRIATCEEGLYLNQQISNSRLIIIENTAHFMFMEQSKKVSEEISNFLATY